MNQNIPLLHCHELHEAQKHQKNYTLLDVREEWEYDICHLDDSILIPLGTLHNKYNQLDKNSPTVVICHSGVRSLHAAKMLTSLGFKKVYNLIGGIDEWARQIDTTMKTY